MSAVASLLQQPEGKQRGFKRDLSSPLTALKTLVAFANSAGGGPLGDWGGRCAPSRQRVQFAGREGTHRQPDCRWHFAALARSLGHRSVSGELHKQIDRLLAQSLITITRPDKPQSRLQRYRLTQQGRALLATLQTQENP